MCGIAGIWHLNKDKVSKEKLKRFTDSMFHRGPDGAGYELFDNDTLGLGQRRLSILDLSENGKQPMSYADGRYWITYNGEVFNFEQIKHELEALGYKFISETDTEVILASFIAWGKACLDKFNGMWAFAIWDELEQQLFLSRDRFGIKPLYYTHQQDQLFAFASETRAFKFLNGFERTVDAQLLDLNIKDSYALEGLGYTIFKDIYQILPGHYMVVKKNEPIQQKRWWHIDDHLHQEIPKTLKEQAEKFYEIFKDACRMRLVSDVPLATALSGGLDSSSVYSVVNDILKNENIGRVNSDSQRAFSAIFPDLPQNEKEYADLAVQHFGGTINYIETDYTNLKEQIAKDTELCDFISNAPITAVSAVYKGMKQHGITVSLDGHGVDEMLYGYRDMVYNLFNDSLYNNHVKSRDEIKKVLIETYHPELRKVLKDRLENNIQKESGIISSGKRFIKGIARKLLKPETEQRLEYLPFKMPQTIGEPYDFSNKTFEERMVYHEFFEHCLPSLLRDFDRAAMMNSVEIRMPFMDWRLVTYVFSLPFESKIGKGFTKLLIREAMKGKMDETVRTRTFKVGIGSPVDYWFNGKLKDWVLDKIEDNSHKESLIIAYNNGGLDNQQVREAWHKINIELIK
ncbi:MAG: asparagine synthase (glutamine-hydrolyzing) [Bacteroidota bacterium]|nr:asparagine synthase (glutamine-hydrolyzing) [Bacteroidota bacterium]